MVQYTAKTIVLEFVHRRSVLLGHYVSETETLPISGERISSVWPLDTDILQIRTSVV
jgi:hypothetical protein